MNLKDKIVEDYCKQLSALEIAYEVLEHPQLVSVEAVQKYLGYGMDDSAATIVMKADEKFIAIIRRGDTKLDSTKVKKLLGVTTLRMATEEEFAAVTGVPSGAASVYIPNIPIFLDKRIFEKKYINAGSGSLLYTIRYKSEDLKKIPRITIIDVTILEKSSQQSKQKVVNKRFLSGITPSGDGSLHIGNFLGAVRQFIELAKTNETYLMVADLHGLTTIQDKKQLQHNIETLVLNELALLKGFTTKEEFEKIVFFRQSDVPMHTECQSILNNVTPLGLLKRAHAYKDKLQKDVLEDDVNVGLFSYPMLMAADILLYQPDLVPVGKDQKQHIEITRDVAYRFNKTYKTHTFKLPEPYIPEEVAVVLGTDGKRKMSKSLGNIIAMFEPEDVIKKQVMGTYTDPTRKHATDPGHIEGNMVFTYLDFFGDPTSPRLRGAGKVQELKDLYKAGKVSDVAVKEYLFESLMIFFAPARIAYEELKANPDLVKNILRNGQERAMTIATQTMKDTRDAMGITTQYSFFEYGKLSSGKTISIDDFARVEVRVGKVLEATNKEGSDKLIRLVVDVGPASAPADAKAMASKKASAGEGRDVRVIFTAVRPFGYTPEYFAKKQFFFITNLLPRKMLDEESQGMILAVDGDPSTSSGQRKPLFISAEGMPIGAKIR